MPVQPGDVGLVITSGLGPGLVRLGDAIYARRTGTRHETFNHVVISVGNGLAVCGDPHGATLSSDHSWSRTTWKTYRRPLNTSERATLARAARALIGTPYSWIDIACLTLQQLGWNVQRDDGKLTALGKRISDDRRLVCSQLVALVYAQCGLPLFLDRGPGEVSPGDLARSPLFVPIT